MTNQVRVVALKDTKMGISKTIVPEGTFGSGYKYQPDEGPMLWAIHWEDKGFGLGAHPLEDIKELPPEEGKPDKRTRRGKELAQRLNKETVLEQMPRLYYVEDPYNGGYRVGRSDWAGDQFNIVPKAEFEIVLKVLNDLNYPIDDKTHDD